MSRPRWTIFVSGKPGPDRRYLFKDNDPKPEDAKPDNGVTIGTTVHFFDGAFTTMKDPEDAILFCDFLNRTQP